jgi:hypothetical protein
VSLWDRAWQWLNERADWLVDYGTDDADEEEAS